MRKDATFTSIVSILRAFRIGNLVIVALTMLLFDFVLTHHQIQSVGELTIGSSHLMITILFAVLIASGGYTINDIYDLKTDQDNNQDSKSVTVLGLKNARIFYIVSQTIALILAIYLSQRLDYWGYFWMAPTVIVVLWLYSAYLKGLPVIGNIVVAGLCSLVIYFIWIAESHLLLSYKNSNPEFFESLKSIFIQYGIFSFLLTWIREIVKDIEDINGDRINNKLTQAVVFGVESSKKTSFILLGILTLLTLAFGFLWLQLLQDNFVVVGVFVLFIRFCLLGLLIRKASTKQEFGNISLQLKWTMVFGLILLLIALL